MVMAGYVPLVGDLAPPGTGCSIRAWAGWACWTSRGTSFNMVVAPWLETAGAGAAGAAVPLGVLTAGQLLLVLFILGLGSGVVAMCALLLSGDRAGTSARRPCSMCCWWARWNIS